MDASIAWGRPAHRMRFSVPVPPDKHFKRPRRRGRKDLEQSAQEDAKSVLTAAEMREFERGNLERALAQSNGQVYGTRGAAALLGMKPTTLWSRLRSLGISTGERL